MEVTQEDKLREAEELLDMQIDDFNGEQIDPDDEPDLYLPLSAARALYQALTDQATALAAKEAELAAEIVEKIVRDLALSEIANFERASVEWLEGLRFARERVRATLAETQPERTQP